MKARLRFACVAVAVVSLGAVAAVVRLGVGPNRVHTDMAAAARGLLESLTPELRAKCAAAFDDKARTDWSFVPQERHGVTFGEMNDQQRRAARTQLRSALSSQGVLKVEQIMALDGVLREIERNPGRDPLKYVLAVYGQPGEKGAWGWKIEGHHISLNFTCVDGEVRAHTPSFLGANPAEVRSGPLAGVRALALEEDLGRELVRSLSAEQRAAAVIADTAPADILLIPGRGFDSVPAQGLEYAKMTPEQRGVLMALLEEYAHTLRRELAHEELKRIRNAGLDGVLFAWAGGLEPGTGHYYRISGPTFVIEYDNTQNNANHVHTVWHDRTRNFGADALREHYKHGHPHD